MAGTNTCFGFPRLRHNLTEFETDGSMYGALEEVRNESSTTIEIKVARGKEEDSVY